MPGDLLRAMASDLGVQRMAKEPDGRFIHRVSYSALRFWMQAFCLDDGYGGSYGVSASAVIRKSTIWLRNLADLYPGILEWYGFNEDGGSEGLSSILRMLIRAGDLVRTEDGLYRCTAAHTVPVGTRSHMPLGLTDPTDTDGTTPLSGMASIAFAASASPARRRGTALPQTSNAIMDVRPSGDERHVFFDANRSFRASPDLARFHMLTWPALTVTDARHRLARVEYVPMLVDLLHGCGIAVQASGFAGDLAETLEADVVALVPWPRAA